MRDLHQVIGAHQPNETNAGETSGQGRYRIRRVDRSQGFFQRADHDARMAGDSLGRCHTGAQRDGIGRGLERILRGDQPPHRIQAQTPQGRGADRAVARMRRIEGATEQTDTLARDRQAATQGGAKARERLRYRVQGLTCPLPRTTYL